MLKKRKNIDDVSKGHMNSGLLLYVIKDTVSQDIGPLFEAISDDVACRKIAHEFADMPPVMVNDYELHCIGYINRIDGQAQLYSEDARIVDFKPLWHVLQGIKKAKADKVEKKALEAANEV